MTDRPLLDRQIPAIDCAIAEVRRIRLMPPADRPPHAERDSEAAIMAAMLAARIGRYQCRDEEGQLVHVSLQVPEPKVNVRFDWKQSKKKPASNLNASTDKPTP